MIHPNSKLQAQGSAWNPLLSKSRLGPRMIGLFPCIRRMEQGILGGFFLSSYTLQSVPAFVYGPQDASTLSTVSWKGGQRAVAPQAFQLLRVACTEPV